MKTSAPTDGSGAMFDGIAPRYDLLNRLLSLGLDGSWRRRLVQALDLPPGGPHVLDVATGTADVALTLCRQHPTVRVTGLDPSAQMLARGRQKVARAELRPRITLVEGDVAALPFAEGTFDACCISFGIRNVKDRLGALQEMSRVCRPGSPLVVLELGEPPRAWWGQLARLYIRRLVPVLGGLLSRGGAYAYLQQSIAAFLSPREFMALMQRAGLQQLRHQPLNFGSVNLFVAKTPSPRLAAGR